MHKPIYHVIMSIFKNSIIIDKLYNLLRLYIRKDPFLWLNELVECLKLLWHVVYGLINYFIYLDKFMVTKACHLWIRICMLLKTIITERKLMSSAILSYFLVMGSTDSEWHINWDHLHLPECPYRRKQSVMFINGFHQS